MTEDFEDESCNPSIEPSIGVLMSRRALLGGATEALTAAGAWTVEATEQAIRGFVEAKGAKLGQVAQPLRAALTGRSTSPGIFTVLMVLGRQESLARLRDQIG